MDGEGFEPGSDWQEWPWFEPLLPDERGSARSTGSGA